MQDENFTAAVTLVKPRGRPRRLRMNEESEAAQTTRDAIFTAAIQQFAAFGFDGAHVRKMLIAADANMALAHYYFGSKASLYDAVLSHFITPVLADRRARLAAWRLGAGAPAERLVDLFTAYVEPHFIIAAASGGRDYARLMQRALGSNDGPQFAMHDEIYAVRAEFVAELNALLPEIDAATSTFAFNALVSIMLSESQAIAAAEGRTATLAAQQSHRAASLVAAGLVALARTTIN